MPDRPRVVAIVQARMGSTRLPGKAMANIAGRPMTAWVLARLRRAARVDEVRLAIPDSPENEPLAELAAGMGVGCTRGSEQDVLGRYLKAAQESGADHVVRVTSDCPFVDPAVVDAAVEHHLKTGADYTSSGAPPEYPRGFDVEAATHAALQRAGREAERPYDREHVTAWFYREEGRFLVAHVAAPEELRRPDLRVCVDTEQDLAVANVIAGYFGERDDFGVRQIVAFLDAHPEVADMNRGVEQRARAKVAFWIDYGPGIGTGHLARARALAGALAVRGALSRAFYPLAPEERRAFALDEETRAVGPQPKPREMTEFRLVPLLAPRRTGVRRELLGELDAFEARCVVVDAFTAQPSEITALREAGLLVAAFDDLYRVPPADILVNPNMDATPAEYRAAPSGTEVLAGVEYFPAREELVRAARAARERTKERTGGAPASRRVLLAFGGSDPARLTVPVLRALLSLAPPVEVDVVLGPLVADETREGTRALEAKQTERVSVREAPDSLAEPYARADVAVAAGGVMKYEIALFGLPSVLVTVADNQRAGTEALARAGACRYLGEATGAKRVSPARIALAAAELLNDADARARMSAAGRRLVDGGGAARCAASILGRLEASA